MPVAYSYKRFSSDAQTGNDSIRRQTDAAIRFVHDHPEHNLTLDNTLNLTDAGVSAYRGRNKEEGALGVFVEAVRDRLVPVGSWLLFESLDRFSRQTVNRAAADLLYLINSGIVVVTLHNGVIYREEDFDSINGMVNLLGAMIAMQGHHQEQVEKGQRVAAAWKAKRDRISSGHILTHTIPFWLSVDDRKTKFVIIEDRANLVREVFQRRSEGEGKTKIANDFNRREVPTPKGRSPLWHPSAIDKILNSVSVTGVLVTTHGDRYEDYYPKIVENDLYQCVQALKQQPARLGASLTAHPLTGLVKHDCGTTMRRVNKGSRSRIRLRCPHCGHAILYSLALQLIGDALMSLQFQAAPTTSGDEIHNMEGYLMNLGDEIQDAYQRWRDTKTRADRLLYERLCEERDALQVELRDLVGKNTEVLVAMENQALLRAERFVDAIGRVATSIQFDSECKTLTLTSISGKVVTAQVDDGSPFL